LAEARSLLRIMMTRTDLGLSRLAEAQSQHARRLRVCATGWIMQGSRASRQLGQPDDHVGRSRH